MIKNRTDQRTIRTKELLLNAAEKLFAERGLEGASMREVTGMANVNLAAANYHFGGKEGLYHAVIKRQMKWISERKFALLEVAKAEKSLQKWVEAYFIPSIERIRIQGEQGKLFVRLLSRSLLEDPEVVTPLIANLYNPVNDKFAEVLSELIPEFSKEDLFWCMHMITSVLQHTLLHYTILEDYAPHWVNERKLDEILNHMVNSAIDIIKGYQVRVKLARGSTMP